MIDNEIYKEHGDANENSRQDSLVQQLILNNLNKLLNNKLNRYFEVQTKLHED